ncbi:Biotin-protein ligase [Smittium culicis]|uniref:Biotin-protein ligase n=1 Tax=Smittium culicis TaxID=133412 RepID=A0A1R1YU43_9FUNG|nr:Biotin-protein ligase [Smittium culicis]
MQAINTFREILDNTYTIITVESIHLESEAWENTTALLVIPGGRDIFYNRDLKGAASFKIQNYVKKGGKYLGFCGGGYFGCSKIVFEPNSPIQVIGDRPLCFFPDMCKGAAFPGFRYDSDISSRAVKISIEKESFKQKKKSEWISDSESDPPYVYYNGGGYFANADLYSNRLLYELDIDSSNVSESQVSYTNILSRYCSDVSDPENRSESIEGAAAVIACHYGMGIAILTGVHIEFSSDAFCPSGMDSLPKSDIDRLKYSENARIRYVISIFHYLGLDVNIEAVDQSSTLPKKPISPTFIVPIKEDEEYEVGQLISKLNQNANNHLIHDTFNTIDYRHINSNSMVSSNEKIEELIYSTVDNKISKLYILNNEFLPAFKPYFSFDIIRFKSYMLRTNANFFGNWLMYSEVTNSNQTFLKR